MVNNSHNLIFLEIKERLKDQLDSASSLDNKAGITLGLVGALLVGLLNSSWFIQLRYYYLLTILILMVATVICLLKAYFVRTYRKDPEPKTLIDGYQNKPEDETIRQLIRNFENCFNKNKKPLESKKRYLNWGFKLLALTVFAICLIVFLSTQIKTHGSYYKHGLGVSNYGRYR
jgi:hypothetical protein